MKDKPAGKAKKKLAAKAGETKEPGVKKEKVAKKNDSKHNALPRIKKDAAKAGKADSAKGNGKQPKRKPLLKKPPERPVEKKDPFDVARETVKDSVPEIVKTLVEKAMQGSCTHAKTLLEMTGAKHMFESDAEEQDSGEPWAKLVLERLDEAERAEAGNAATDGAPAVGAGGYAGAPAAGAGETGAN